MITEVVPTVRGWIKIIGIKPNGERIVLVDKKNALVINAKKIIAQTLGQQSLFSINTVEVYKTGGLLASTSMIPTFPADEKVKFNGRFNETSFNDTLDEIRLTSTIGGQFSVVTGLSVLKNNTLQLEIEWLLTINDI